MIEAGNIENLYTVYEFCASVVCHGLFLVWEDCPQKVHGHPSENTIRIAPPSGEIQSTSPPSHSSHPSTLAVCSPARSKRGSPANATDDEGDYQVISHQRKKKGPVLPSRHSTSSSTMIDSPDLPLTTSTAATLTRANPASPSFTTDPNVSAQASQLAASTRYALSRFPFPPLILRFKSMAVKSAVKKILDEISARFNTALNSKITFPHGRPSNVRCDLNEIDLLLYVKDVSSLATLLDQGKWHRCLSFENY